MINFQEKVLLAPLPEHINLNDNETIAFDHFSYLAAFNELIEMTPKRTIVNFIIMRIVQRFSVTLTGEDKSYEKETSLWERKCMVQVLHNLPILLNSIYIRNYFDKETKSLVLDIIRGVKSEFMKVLESNSWMDDTTKLRAIKKLENMGALIGFPNELLDDKVLKKHFENLTIHDNFFESTLSISTFNNYQKFRNLKNDINKTDWLLHYSVTDINAFYYPYDNIISK